jgi:hypothetical protein
MLGAFCTQGILILFTVDNCVVVAYFTYHSTTDAPASTWKHYNALHGVWELYALTSFVMSTPLRKRHTGRIIAFTTANAGNMLWTIVRHLTGRVAVTVSPTLAALPMCGLETTWFPGMTGLVLLLQVLAAIQYIFPHHLCALVHELDIFVIPALVAGYYLWKQLSCPSADYLAALNCSRSKANREFTDCDTETHEMDIILTPDEGTIGADGYIVTGRAVPPLDIGRLIATGNYNDLK